MTKSCISFLSIPHAPTQNVRHKFGTQERNVCIGFCKKVSVWKLQRGEYLMRRHDFGKNSLPARAMEEDTSPHLPDNQKCYLCPIPPTPQPTHLSVIAEYEIILLQIRLVLLECGYTHFPCKTSK